MGTAVNLTMKPVMFIIVCSSKPLPWINHALRIALMILKCTKKQHWRKRNVRPPKVIGMPPKALVICVFKMANTKMAIVFTMVFRPA